jgi:hypothetical protein
MVIDVGVNFLLLNRLDHIFLLSSIDYYMDYINLIFLNNMYVINLPFLKDKILFIKY